MGFWQKILNRIKPDYTTFETDYLLLHEILQTLRNVGMTVTATGSDSQGHIPIYEFQINTARLHFGTLAGLLNNPEDFKKNNDVKVWHFQDYIAKREEVKEIKYKWQEIADAIETLKARKEIDKNEISPYSDTYTKVINLTKNGLASLNTKKYLKQYQEERDKKIAYQSTITTNFWMKLFTGVMALASVFALLIQIFTCNKKTILEYPKEKEAPKSQGYEQNNIYIGIPPVGYNIDTLRLPISLPINDTAKSTPKPAVLPTDSQ